MALVAPLIATALALALVAQFRSEVLDVVATG